MSMALRVSLALVQAALTLANHAIGNHKTALFAAFAFGFAMFSILDKALRNHYGTP